MAAIDPHQSPSTRLSRELEAVEKSYGAALDSMEAAVLIQEPSQGIVYANDAAARQFDVPDREGVVRQTPEEIATAWITTDQEGRLLTPDRYPTRRIFSGEDLYPEPLITRGVHRETGRETWVSVTARPVFNDEGDLQFAVSVSEDITAIKRAELFQTLLAQVGEVMSSYPSDEALHELAKLMVPDFADWCSISMPGPNGTIEEVALSHRDPAKVERGFEYHRTYPRRMTDPAGSAAILRGEPPILVEITDELLESSIPDPGQLAALRELGMRSVIQVPIQAPGGRPAGALNLVNAESLRTFGPEHFQLVLEVGRRVGIAIENARLLEQQSAVADVLRRSLMPAELPSIPGFSAKASYRPAGDTGMVGGDFYDAFHIPGGWVLIVGDIAGHGVQAASLTAQARHVLRGNTMFTGNVVQAVSHLNRVLCAETEMSMCTVCAVTLPDDPDYRPATILCAGHPLPVLVRDGSTAEVGECGPLIGAFDDSRFNAVELRLEPDDLLLMYTDGLLDTRGTSDRYGSERLHKVLRNQRTPDEAISGILDDITAFEHGPHADDTAIVAVQRLRGAA